ncbi:MAG TPA: hypothetical protein VET23_06910 [Chitinophagaceae bacterium]|nr:hypothetical protein [Chitinophagaceae bacterium]
MINFKKAEIKKAGYCFFLATTCGILGEKVHLPELSAAWAIGGVALEGFLHTLRDLFVLRGAHKISEGLPSKLNGDLERAIKASYQNTINDLINESIVLFDLKEPFFSKFSNFIRHESSESEETKKRLKETFFEPLLNSLIDEEEISKMLENNQQLQPDEYLKKLIADKSLSFYDDEKAQDHNEFVNYVAKKFSEHFRKHFRTELKNDDRAKTVYFTTVEEAILRNTEVIKGHTTIIKEDTADIRSKVNILQADINLLTKDKLPKPKREIPKELKDLAEEAWGNRNNAFYEKAIEQVEIGIAKSKLLHDEYSEAYFNSILATILHEKYQRTDEAIAIELNCIEIFKKYNDIKRTKQSYLSLSNFEVHRESLFQAKSYAQKAFQLTLDNKQDSKYYFIELAQCHNDLGWVEHQLGNYTTAINEFNKGLSLLISEEIKNEIDEEKVRKHLIAISHHHLGLSYERLGDVINTKDNYKKSVDAFKQIGFQYDLAKVLFQLSHVHFIEAEYEEGENYLTEAAQIYLELKEYGEYVRCLDLKGKVNFTLGKEETAYGIFLESCSILEEHGGNWRLLEELYHKVGEINLQKEDFERASEYYNKSKKLSEQQKHFFGIADSMHGLAKVEKQKGNDEEYKELLTVAISVLSDSLTKVEADDRKAFYLGTIGHYYELIEKYQEALQFFFRAKSIYDQKQSVVGAAKCLGEIARIYHLLKRANEAFDTMREIKKLVDGTPYYELIAGTAINIANYELDLGNYSEAKIFFQEADFLNKKYNLRFNRELKSLKDGIRYSEKINQPTEITFEELYKDLFDFIDWYPDAKNSIFRMWIYCRKHELGANIKSLHGIKLMLCENDLSSFKQYSKDLTGYFELSLMVVSDEFPDTGLDIVPFPKDKIIYPLTAFPAGKEIDGVRYFEYLTGSIESRYTLCAGSVMTSEITGNEGLVITGWAPGLPPQAYNFFLNSTPSELLERKILFLPHERHKANDKLLSDLHVAKEYDLLPLYISELPFSEFVSSVEYFDFKIPLLNSGLEKGIVKSLRKFKTLLKKLSLAKKVVWRETLNELRIEIDEINELNGADKFLSLRLNLLEYQGLVEKENHSVLLLK